MWLFKKKSKAKIDDTEQASVGTRIGKGIVKLQAAFAERMNAAVSKVPVRKLKTALVLFCLLSGGISTYYFINGLLGSNGQNSTIVIDQTSVPKHFDKSGDEIKDVENIIDEELLGEIKTFRSYMDSLKQNDAKGYDSILVARPGLMDSIKAIEEIYLSQQIK